VSALKLTNRQRATLALGGFDSLSAAWLIMLKKPYYS
jgi:hypothetical protein